MTGQIIYSVKGESDELKAAVASAQATFKFFWRELSWEARRIVKSLDMAAVKMSFVLDADDPNIPAVENMWVTDIEFVGDSISGQSATVSEKPGVGPALAGKASGVAPRDRWRSNWPLPG